MNNTSYYRIEHYDGRQGTYDTMEQAIDALLERYPHAQWGHDGDLFDGGDRTLVWANGKAASGGASQAVAAIVRVGDYDGGPACDGDGTTCRESDWF